MVQENVVDSPYILLNQAIHPIHPTLLQKIKLTLSTALSDKSSAETSEENIK